MYEIFVNFMGAVLVTLLSGLLWHLDRELAVTAWVVALMVSVLLFVANLLRESTDAEEDDFEDEDTDVYEIEVEDE
jgi:hypothetical protein